jgi:hypothetical protein
MSEEVIMLYPSRDSAILEPRADGNFNLHNQETGATTWNITAQDAAGLRVRSESIARLEAEAQSAALRDAVNEAHSEALKENKHRIAEARAAKKTERAGAAPSDKPKRVIPATTDYKNFLPSWLKNPHLGLHTRAATLLAARDEYAKWTSGESFNGKMTVVEEPLKLYTWSPFHEWQLSFTYDAAVSYPFPIVDSGMGGGLALGEPAGILLGNKVRVSFKSIIEPLVRAGLRA